jgi:ABC-2 type transport system ATP-binding protein
MTDTPAIRIRDLVKRYGDRTALDGLSADVGQGTRTVLLGPNGAGKSTTLEIVSTLRTPTSGDVTVCGYDVVRQAPEVRRSLGLTPQNDALDPLMTPVEVLTLQAVALGFTSASTRRRVDELIALLGLSAEADRRLERLSGGTRRRVALAVALVGSPSLIVLDEPTTGLDPLSRLDLWEELRRLNREYGTTLFISTQDLHEAEVLATELLLLRAGRLAAQGTAADLKRLVGGRALVVTLTGPERLAGVAGALRSPYSLVADSPSELRIVLADDGAGSVWPAVLGELAGFAEDIAGLRVEEPGLDDVFVSFAGAGREVAA